ncbi:hypothetical protein THOG05_460014 [Vibrio rotiferianus]|nr:hypothetical protein THOG05_460014 [Vibrio rotiferianus]CAH1568761.1 hypothetical protein THOE12_250014 [Vibrio rotiferianus]
MWRKQCKLQLLALKKWKNCFNDLSDTHSVSLTYLLRVPYEFNEFSNLNPI